MTSSAPPVLLNRGDANTTATTSGLQRWRQPFAAKVPVTLVRIPRSELGSDFGAAGKPHPECACFLGEMIHRLNHELKAAPASAAK